MAAAQTSNVLLDNVNKILSTFVPAINHKESNHIFTSIGVKSRGTITFPDNKSNRAEFIRIPPDAQVMQVKELLSRRWCSGLPSLVISITGGAKEYNMKPRLLRAFRRGLHKVARTTGAWIITGGMNTGIMKLVGEIVQINPDRYRPVHLIGIATWGCVSGYQQLDVNGSTVHYAKPRTDKKGEAPLEPNHTEFIFVDDGSHNKYGGEIAFRAKLEQAISGGFFASKATANPNNQYKSLTATPSMRTEQSNPVPVVLLVVEGGPNTVRTVHEAVVQNNIPAVFLEGTGRCCDLFAKAYRLYNEHRHKFELVDETAINMDPSVLLKRYDDIKNKLREELKEELRAISGAGDGANAQAGKLNRKSTPTTADSGRAVDTTDYFELVYECIDTRTNFLNVISLSSRNIVEPDIDLVILQALLNATSGSDTSKTNIQRKREQLHLALEWNRVDIAKNFIMKNERDWEKIDLNDLFLLALERNQKEFVKLFLDHDFSLTDLFRDNDKLLGLYTKDLKDTYDFTNVSHDQLQTIYKEIIQPLIGDFFEVNAVLHPENFPSKRDLDDENEDESCSCCVLPCSGRHYHAAAVSDRGGSAESDASTTYPDCRMDVDKELFLWSIITGRREFALLFWSRGKNKICAALIATLVYKKLAHEKNDDSYNQSAEEFENLAVQILNKFYQSHPHGCTKALIRQIPAYGNVTWLELAAAAEAKQFISQRASQDVLNNIWYGFIDPKVANTTIVFSTFMLWFSGFLRYHDELVKSNEETTFLEDSLNKSHSLQQQSSNTRGTVDRTSGGVHRGHMSSLTDVNVVPVDFVDFGCWEKTRTRVYRYFGKITTFMRAPYVKYLYNLYLHVMFLLLFSYVILCDLHPLYDFQSDVCAPVVEPVRIQDHAAENNDNRLANNRTLSRDGHNSNKSVTYDFHRRKRPANTEIVLVIWIFTLLCEEIRQLITIEAQSRRNAIAAYFKVFWNKLDVLAIILFFVGFALRFFPTTECFCAARIVLSVDLSIWFIRSLDIFAAIKRLGPKLVMIGEMVHDLKFFMIMLTVFILAFGVSSYSLIYGVQEFTWHLPREVINLAYWQIFGELNALETFEQNFKPNGYAAFILLVAYMAIVSILLVNLLIAMFSNTFDRLQTDTDRIWKFQRYSLVCEYLSRPSLPPPLIFFSHLWRLGLYILSLCIKSKWIQKSYNNHKKRTKYKIFLDEKNATQIEILEDSFGDEVYFTHINTGRKSVDEVDIDEERVTLSQSPQENLLNKVRTLESRIQTISSQQDHMFDYLECLMEGLKSMGGERIRMPERRRFDPDESLINTQVDDEPPLISYHRAGYHSI